MSGMSVMLLDTEPRTRNYYITLAIADALRRDIRVNRVVLAHHGDALRVFHEEGLDTFIAFGGARVHSPLLSRLAALAKLSILWTTEDPYEVDNNVRFSTSFDYVFTNDKASVPLYNGRAYHLPLAAAPEFQNLPVRSSDAEYRYDLLFIGTAWPNRVRSLNQILRAAPRQLKVKLALPYNEFIGPPALDDPGPLTNWRCGNSDFARFANSSRVVLTLPRAFSASSEQRASGSTPPPRLFETALAGGFQVMVSSEPETTNYYNDGAEVRLCSTDEEALTAIFSALEHAEQRIAMAQAARTRTLREHLYEHRINKMLDLVAESVPQKIAPPLLPKRQTILYVSHNRIGYRPGGGIEVYQEVLGELEPDYNVLFLFPVIRESAVELHLEGNNFRRTFMVPFINGGLLTEPTVEGVFQEILFRHQISLVHFHHLIHMPLSLPLIAKACGVPSVYQLHDYYLICERFLLINSQGRFCDVVNRGSQQCDACMLRGNQFPPGSKGRRNLFMSHVISAIDVFISSTPFAGDYLRGFYPEIGADRIHQIEMITPGNASSDERHERDVQSAAARRELTVAIIGSFNHHKGAEDILDVIRLCREYPIRFKIFGHLDVGTQNAVRDISSERIVFAGAYEQSDIMNLLQGCDVSLHLSIWPETFVIALGEAWKAGLIPIVSDMGALQERVQDGVDGYIVPVNDPGTVLQRLLSLHLDRPRLTAMRQAVLHKAFVTKEHHLGALKALYKRLIVSNPCPVDRVPDRVDTRYDLILQDIGVRVNDARWTSSAIVWDADYARVIAGAGVVPAGGGLPQAGPLPPEHAVLPAKHFDFGEAGQYYWIDRLELDGIVTKGRLSTETARRSLYVQGWFRPDPTRQPVATYIKLVGSEDPLFCRLTPEARGDLAPEDGGRAAAPVGFQGRLDLSAVGAGFYTLSFLQIVEGQRYETPAIMRLFVLPNPSSTIGSVWSPNWQGHGSKHVASVKHYVQNLPSADHVLAAVTADRWALQAAVDYDAIAAKAVAVLVDEMSDEQWWTHAHWRPGEDGGRGLLTLDVNMSNLSEGSYRLEAELTDKTRIIRIDTPVRLHVGPQDWRFRFSENMPAVFRPYFIRRVKSGLSIDLVERKKYEDRNLIRCRGWAFTKGYGSPLGMFATWKEGERVQNVVSALIERLDAAAHLKNKDAQWCGFDLGVPEDLLLSGKIRFYQCYAKKTVEYGHMIDRILLYQKQI